MRTLASAVLALTTSFGIAKEENIIAHQNVREDLLDSLNEQQILFIDDSLKKNEHQLKKKNSKNLRTSTGSDEDDEETSINHYSPGKGKDHRSHFSNDGVLSNINPPRAQDLDEKDTSKDKVSTEEGTEQNADVGILRVLTGTTAGTTTAAVASLVPGRRICSFVYGSPSSCPPSPPYNACDGMGTAVRVEVVDGSCQGNSFECGSVLGSAQPPGTASIGCGSCLHSYACRYIGEQATGAFSFQITVSSCYGINACTYMGRNAQNGCTFYVDNSSCRGFHACKNLGKDAIESSFMIKDMSCYGYHACSSLGSKANTQNDVTIEYYSCSGLHACSFVADSAVNANVAINRRSCIGEHACASVGQNITAGATIDIGHGACYGTRACFGVGKYSNHVSIGEMSCRGYAACASTSTAASAPGTIQIGKDACTCDGCCTDLLPGSTVGDGKCKSIQENCYSRNVPVIV